MNVDVIIGGFFLMVVAMILAVMYGDLIASFQANLGSGAGFFTLGQLLFGAIAIVAFVVIGFAGALSRR